MSHQVSSYRFKLRSGDVIIGTPVSGSKPVPIIGLSTLLGNLERNTTKFLTIHTSDNEVVAISAEAIETISPLDDRGWPLAPQS